MLVGISVFIFLILFALSGLLVFRGSKKVLEKFIFKDLYRDDEKILLSSAIVVIIFVFSVMVGIATTIAGSDGCNTFQTEQVNQ